MMNKFSVFVGLVFLAFPKVLFCEQKGEEYLRICVERFGIKKVIEGEDVHCTKSLTQLYYESGFDRFFNDKETSKKVLKFIGEADEHGLFPADYHKEIISDLIRNYEDLTPERLIHLDILLSDGFLLFSSHLLSGKVSPITFDSEWHVVKREGDPLEVFKTFLKNGNAKQTLEDISPKNSVYDGLKKAFRNYSSIKEKGGWPAINLQRSLKSGMNSDQVPVIKKRLMITGDYSSKDNKDSQEFDEALNEAVRKFQKRNGLEEDGAVGPNTLKALNTTVDQKIEQIKVNMERWRWLPQEYGDYYIKVNIADFTLGVFEGNKLVRHHKVVAGKPLRRTPIFNSKMSYIVFNPTWTVPPGILKNDIIPDMQKGINAIDRKKLTIYNSKGEVVSPSSINWNTNSPKAFSYVQNPGPENALGAVKFMFPNPFHVYLHDTPSKDLFDKSERAFSSGCVRVQNPLALAEFLINDPKLSIENINSIVKTQKTQSVILKRKPDVYILYWTAWINDDGIIQFRKDVYDRDGLVWKALNEKPSM